MRETWLDEEVLRLKMRRTLDSMRLAMRNSTQMCDGTMNVWFHAVGDEGTPLR